MRYILIDKITDLEIGKTLKGIKNVTFSDALGRSTGNNRTTFPAAFVMESMAQAAGLLVALTIDCKAQPVMAKVQQMKIYEWAQAGDQIEVFADLEDLQDAGARVFVKSSLKDVPLAEATIFLSLVSFEDLDEENAFEHRQMLKKTIAELAPEWFGKSQEARIGL